MRRRCQGVALLEAIVSVTILLMLVGSVAYASRIALSVMTESMRETRLLFRVRRALDHFEEQLSRSSRISVVAVTEDGWTVEGMENWFAQLAQQNEGLPVGAAAENVSAQLSESRRALEDPTPDWVVAELRIGLAITNFNVMVGGGMISPGDALRLGLAFNQMQTSIMARALAGLVGTGTGYPGAWVDIEETIANQDPLIAAEPLITAHEVYFRQVVIGADGPEYLPPLDEPPCTYYLRPMANSTLFELVYYDGVRSIVVADHLTDALFERVNDTLKITLLYEEEDDGAIIVRSEVRSVLLRVG